MLLYFVSIPYRCLQLSYGVGRAAPAVIDLFVNGTAKVLASSADAATKAKIKSIYELCKQQYKFTNVLDDLVAYSSIFPFPKVLKRFTDEYRVLVEGNRVASAVKAKVTNWSTGLLEGLEADLVASQNLTTNNLLLEVCKDPDLIDIWKLLEKCPSLRKNTDKLKAFREIQATQLLNDAELAKVAENISQWKDQSKLLDDLVAEARSSSRSKARLIALANRNEGLLTKLGADPYKLVEAWVDNNKTTIRYGAYQGDDATTEVLKDLNSQLEGKNIIATLNGTRGRLVIQTERGASSNRVFCLEPKVGGEMSINVYEPAYKPSARAEIDVDISINSLSPQIIHLKEVHICIQTTN